MEIQPTTKLNNFSVNFSFNLKDIPTNTTTNDKIERRVIDEKIKFCSECNHFSSGSNGHNYDNITNNYLKTTKDWCKKCNSERFQKNSSNWTSGNKEIDEYIKSTQLS